MQLIHHRLYGPTIACMAFTPTSIRPIIVKKFDKHTIVHFDEIRPKYAGYGHRLTHAYVVHQIVPQIPSPHTGFPLAQWRKPGQVHADSYPSLPIADGTRHVAR